MMIYHILASIYYSGNPGYRLSNIMYVNIFSLFSVLWCFRYVKRIKHVRGDTEMSWNTKHRSIKNCQLINISQLYNYVYISYNFIFTKVFSQLNTRILRNRTNLHLLIQICIIRSSRSTMVGVVRYSLTPDLLIKSNCKT